MKQKAVTFIAMLFVLFCSKHLHGQKIPISVFGYFDLIASDFSERVFPNGATENPPPTFILLRTHILFNSNFAQNWRAFINIRFLNGADLGTGDHGDKGHIEILEGWFEYRYRDWLRIRGGQFLAPFGYFNSRKFQSPIFNTVVLPVMYEEEFLGRASAGTIIPPQQNLQILGELRFESWRMGYRLYIGNGSDTNEDNLDVNANKGVGTRIWVQPPIRNLTLGASFYTEKSHFTIRPHMDMKAMMVQAQASGTPVSRIVPILPEVTESETRRTISTDVRFLSGDFEIRGEFVKSFISELSLVDASNISDTTQTYVFDGSAFAKTFYYVNLNYTFIDKLTSYFELNVFRDPMHFVFRNELRRLTWGAAFRPNSNVVIKAEFHQHLFGDKFNKKPDNFKNFQMFWAAVSIFFN